MLVAKTLARSVDGDPGLVEFQAALVIEIQKAVPDLHDLLDESMDIAEHEAARLIQSLTIDQERVIRYLISKGLKKGWSDIEIADRIKNVVLLDERRVIAVENYRLSLIENGVGKGDARKKAYAYARQLREERAGLIAQHETNSVIKEAQRRLWHQMVQRGELKYNATRRWVTSKSERRCPVCRPMDGKRTRIGSLYENGLNGPPAHPRCECHEVVDAKFLDNPEVRNY